MKNELVAQKNVDMFVVLKNAWENLPEDLKSKQGGLIIASVCLYGVVYQIRDTYLANKAMDNGYDYSSLTTQVKQSKVVTK